MTDILATEIPPDAIKVNPSAVDAGHTAADLETPAIVTDNGEVKPPVTIPVATIPSSDFFPEIVVGDPVAQRPPVLPPVTSPEPEQSQPTIGRPKGSRNRPKAPDFSDLATKPAIPVDYAKLSNVIFDLTTGVAVSYFGPEWQPKTPEEKNSVTQALEEYLKVKEVKDIPPGLMLTIIVACYAAPRLREPGTSTKLAVWWEKIKFGWGWFKFKFLGKKRQPLQVLKDEQKAA